MFKTRNLILIFIVLHLLSGASSVHAFESDKCRAVLQTTKNQLRLDIRKQALLASKKLEKWRSQISYPASPVGSIRIGADYGSPFPTKKNAHVGYFASGSHLLQLVYDFPDAANYHLFDVMDYWAYNESPGYLLQEIKQAATYLNGGKQLEIIQSGFLDYVPETVLNPKKWQAKKQPQNKSGSASYSAWFTHELAQNHLLWEPLIFKVKIRLPNGAIVEKQFYVHAVNMFDDSQVAYALNQIPTGLQGVITDFIPSNRSVVDRIGSSLRKSGGSVLRFTAFNSNGRDEPDASDDRESSIGVNRWIVTGRELTAAGKDRFSSVEKIRDEFGASSLEVIKGPDGDSMAILKFK